MPQFLIFFQWGLNFKIWIFTSHSDPRTCISCCRVSSSLLSPGSLVLLRLRRCSLPGSDTLHENCDGDAAWEPESPQSKFAPGYQGPGSTGDWRSSFWKCPAQNKGWFILLACGIFGTSKNWIRHIDQSQTTCLYPPYAGYSLPAAIVTIPKTAEKAGWESHCVFLIKGCFFCCGIWLLYITEILMVFEFHTRELPPGLLAYDIAVTVTSSL